MAEYKYTTEDESSVYQYSTNAHINENSAGWSHFLDYKNSGAHVDPYDGPSSLTSAKEEKESEIKEEYKRESEEATIELGGNTYHSSRVHITNMYVERMLAEGAGETEVTIFDTDDMPFLRNRNKLPVVVVGGCHNSQFNVTMANMVKGILKDRLQYFSRIRPYGEYWYNEWVPNCWAWWLTSKANGGAIATIANTGLGTHGDGDADHNNIADYLEVLDGWLELRFYELYGIYQQDDLGENHGQTMTEYLHWFQGSNEKMDTKMVQQWELFGDPSLKIGGYDS